MYLSQAKSILTAAAFSAALMRAEIAPAKVDNPRSVVVGERSVVDVYVSQFQDTLIVLPATERRKNR